MKVLQWERRTDNDNHPELVAWLDAGQSPSAPTDSNETAAPTVSAYADTTGSRPAKSKH